MSDLPTSSPAPRGELIVAVRNTEPLSAAALAALLEALTSDYRAETGRDLTVHKVHQGSLWLHLVDLADQSNHLFDFATNVATLTGLVIAGAVALKRKSTRKRAKTVLAVVDISASGGATVEIATAGADKAPRVLITVTVDQAVMAKQRIDAPVVAAQRRLPPPISEDGPRRGEDLLVDLLRTSAEIQGGRPLSDRTDPSAVILTAVLQGLRERPDGQATIARIVARLRSEGHSAAAELLLAWTAA